MDVILIPGFWLRGDSWDGIAPVLREAGHTVHTPTLPGLEGRDADRSGITLRTHIDAVVGLVDSISGPVALVGHSGGGAIAYGVTDARPDRIDRVVYVDAGPLGDGDSINDQLPSDGDDIPLPDWSVFEDAELENLTEELRAEFRARAVPQPAGVAMEPLELSDDERRLGIRSVVISSTFPAEQFRALIEQDHPYTAELARLRDYDIVELPTGHWPQFTRPAELAEKIVAALA